jgi:sugar/nucleoside kinase (ribokinase family)
MVTRRVLEGRQPRGVARRAPRAATSRGRDHGRGADQPAENERAQPIGAATVVVHGTIVGVLVCTLGDLLLDVIVLTDGPAGPDSEGSVETRVGAGGQSANVAAWAAELGAEARFVGKRGSDGAAELTARELTVRGVQVLGPVEEGRSGVVVSLVSPDGNRTMLSDRGVSPFLRAEELDVRWFGGCDWLHLSGYSLLRRPIEEAAAKATGAVQAQGGRVSIDLASAAGIAEYGPERLLGRLELLRPDVVFANEGELAAIGGSVPGMLILKRGAGGFSADGQDYAAGEAVVVDTTGAGDALAAGYIVEGPELAAEAAARCVGQPGAMP